MPDNLVVFCQGLFEPEGLLSDQLQSSMMTSMALMGDAEEETPESLLEGDWGELLEEEEPRPRARGVTRLPSAASSSLVAADTGRTPKRAGIEKSCSTEKILFVQ